MTVGRSVTVTITRPLAVVAALLSLALASCDVEDPADSSSVEPTEATTTDEPSTEEPTPSEEEPDETTEEPEDTEETTEPTEPTEEPTPAKVTPKGVPADAQAAVVASITDGDTLTLRARRPGPVLRSTASVSVRLLEIDTPETVDPSEPVQCYGPAATDALTRFAPPGSQVWALTDVERTDQYDRLLLYLWRVVDGETLFINRALVINGFAIASLYEPNDAYIDVMQAAESVARSSERGLWAACSRFGAPLDPPEPEPTPQPQPAPPSGGNCDPNYSGACIPPYPPDLDCTEINAVGFQVVGTDVHGFDADGDGIGCDP